MAVQAHFCGVCGAQVPPGAPFCGRCGTRQVALPVATPPAYAYPAAPPRQAAGLRRVGGSQIAVAAGLLIILAAVTVGVSSFVASQVIGTHKTCTSNCGARIVTPLPAPATYKSSAFGYAVEYDPDWTVRTQDGQGVILATKLGQLQVAGRKSGLPLDQVMASVVSALPSTTWQDVAHISDLKGAHIGDQDGMGAVYSANLVGANATAAKVRFFVVVATKGGVTVAIFGVNSADPKNYANGIPEDQEFDSLLQEFQWATG